MLKLNPAFYRMTIALVVGLVLVLYPENASDYLVIAVGVIFMLPSILRIISYSVNRERSLLGFPFDGVGGFLFGLLLVINPGFFGNILTIILGFILTMAGVQQLTSLLTARRWARISLWNYVVPVLILLAGIFSLINPVGVRATLFKVIGSFFLLYAFFEFVNWFFFMRKRPLSGKSASETSKRIAGVAGDDIEDAQIVE